MPTLTVRNIDEVTLAGLKRRAQTGNRSLEAEIREILARAAATGSDDLLAEIRAIHDRILARRNGQPLPTESARMLTGERERV